MLLLDLDYGQTAIAILNAQLESDITLIEQVELRERVSVLCGSCQILRI